MYHVEGKIDRAIMRYDSDNKDAQNMNDFMDIY